MPSIPRPSSQSGRSQRLELLLASSGESCRTPGRRLVTTGSCMWMGGSSSWVGEANPPGCCSARRCSSTAASRETGLSTCFSGFALTPQRTLNSVHQDRAVPSGSSRAKSALEFTSRSRAMIERQLTPSTRQRSRQAEDAMALPAHGLSITPATTAHSPLIPMGTIPKGHWMP